MSDQTALDVVQSGPPAAWGTGGGVQWLAEYERMAQLVCRALTLPQALQGDPRTLLAVALAGKELGLGFMESTRLFHVIQGQPVLSAEAKVRLARAAGHVIVPTLRLPGMIRVQCKTHDSHQVEWDMDGGPMEPDESGTVSFTVASEIMQGGRPLTEKDVWKNYPGQMLWARATSQLIREHCPEVVGGLYSREEIEE